MTAVFDDAALAYAEGMKHYLAAPSESTLEAAYEIGRAAIAQGLGMVEIADAHQRTVMQVLAADDRLFPPRFAELATRFLIEALSPFEMALRGFNERLRGEAADRERIQRALREIESSYESLVVSVRDYAVFMLDAEGRVSSWNPGAERIKGYASEEIVGTHFSVFYGADDREADRPRQMLARAAATGSCQDEGWRVRKDGSRYWAEVLLTARRAENGALTGFTKIVRDATERRKAQQALEELNADLRQADEDKDHFVALIAHELRNPLAAILPAVEVLVRFGSAEEPGRRALEIIRRSTEVQNRLVNDLLEFSRLRRVGLTLERARVALDSVAATAVASQEAEAAQAGVTLTLDADAPVELAGDADRLQQAILNLVANAIKFTPAGGRVQVSVFGAEGEPLSLGPGGALRRAKAPGEAAAACLVVEDTGIGIDAGLLGRLFRPFQQGGSGAQRQRGLGLGLALVKLIAEKHGGRVWAESDGANRGSRFVLALPAATRVP